MDPNPVNVRSIIVAEDDPATRKLVTRQLERAGYSVSAFENGRLAYDAIREMGSGLVLADWMMPEMDGVQLCEAVQQLREMDAIGNLYFILLTSHNDKKLIVRGLEAGANDYLTKPYHEGELLARIRVGDRLLRLQDELIAKRIEVQKANAHMASLAEKLEQVANTDALTGLANRRSLFERLGKVWTLCEETKTDLSVFMLDVDHFKKVNDTYGHHAGDCVLRAVAARVRAAVRGNDIPARFGGEEFVVVCPGFTLDKAAAMAERVRRRLESEPVPVDGQQIQITASFGVAQRHADGDNHERMIGRADEMLYAAKRGGRNQVWLAHPEGERRLVVDGSTQLV